MPNLIILSRQPTGKTRCSFMSPLSHGVVRVRDSNRTAAAIIGVMMIGQLVAFFRFVAT